MTTTVRYCARLVSSARGEPNGAARQLYDAACVYDDAEQVSILHRDALLTLPATQALMQGLHGCGTVSVSGALHFSRATGSLVWRKRHGSGPSSRC
jgi:hypothetical protein